jgi:elongation factor Ts
MAKPACSSRSTARPTSSAATKSSRSSRPVAGVIARSKAENVEALLAEPPGTSEPVSQKVAEQIARSGEHHGRRFERLQTGSRIAHYVHGVKIGVMVEFEGQDAVGKDVAMHIAFAKPRFLRREDVMQKDSTPSAIARDAAQKSGKPENIVEKMVSGKMEKFYAETAASSRPTSATTKTVAQYLASRGKETGCDLQRDLLHRQARRRHREAPEDSAAEVASYMKRRHGAAAEAAPSAARSPSLHPTQHFSV